MPKISIDSNDLLELITAYNDWSGSMHPDDRPAYESRFDKLRKRAVDSINKSARAETQLVAFKDVETLMDDLDN